MGLVFGHEQAKRRQVVDLAALHGDGSGRRKRLPARSAALGPVFDDLVGRLCPAEGGAGMPRLSARPPTALLAQALGSGLGEAIAGGRLAAVVAVFGELGFQRLHPRREQGDLLGLAGGRVQQARHQSDNRLRPGIIDLTYLVGRHSRTLPTRG